MFTAPFTRFMNTFENTVETMNADGKLKKVLHNFKIGQEQVVLLSKRKQPRDLCPVLMSSYLCL